MYVTRRIFLLITGAAATAASLQQSPEDAREHIPFPSSEAASAVVDYSRIVGVL